MPSTIRTLHVDTERTWRGGEQQALYLATGLASRGHVAEVVGHPGSEFTHRARAAGLTAHELPMRGELNPAAIFRLRRLLANQRYDLVHAHTSHAHTLAAIAAALVRGTRCIVSRRVDFEVRRKIRPLRLKYRLGVDRYIAISAAVRDILIEGGVVESLIEVVPSGIDPRRLDDADPGALRTEFKLGEQTQVVGAVAHFAWHKGLEYLINAVPSILAARPETRFFLVGDGELADALKDRASRVAPPGTVLFPGFRGDAPAFLALFDVVATPSVMEGLNTTNLDALALGRPVVASSVGGIPEAVVDGSTGLLVPPRDADALASAVLRLLEDRELATRLGESGRRLIAERFTCDAMVEGSLRVYRNVLDGD